MNKSVKRCSKCKQFKPLSEFYKRKISKDGLQFDCKSCRLKHVKKYNQTKKGKAVHCKSSKKYQKTKKGIKVSRKKVAQYCKTKKGKATFKRYRIRYPERQKARSAINNAIAMGKLPRPDTKLCHYCSAQAQQYHHHRGYAPEHWLDVVSVCMRCHNEHRRKVA